MFCRVCNKAVPRDHKTFCSYTCFRIHSSRTRTEEISCRNCGKKIVIKKSVFKKHKVHFCSIKCRSEHGKVEHTCEFCGKKYRTFKSYVRDGRKYCSRRCLGEHRKVLYLGILNPHFKDGAARIGKKMRRLARYLKWRKEVFIRDKHTCQMCGKILESRFLDVHHKVPLWKLLRDYPEKEIDFNDEYFYSLDNGQTLCRDCHRKTYKE